MASVYLEVGTKCFSICTTCNINDMPRPKETMLKSNALQIIEVLHNIGYNKFRFAGYDPLSCNYLSELMLLLHRRNIVTKITTTLINPSYAALLCTDLHVSLSGVGEYYEEFFGVKKFNEFAANFTAVASFRNDIVINITLSEATSTVRSIRKLVNFINSYSTSIRQVNVFYPMTYISNNKIIISKHMIERYLNRLVVPYKIMWNENGTKMSNCCASKKSLYIKHNGDVYPCCMAGGEIGQTLLQELKLCNIYDYINNPTKLKSIFSIPLTNLDNVICNNCTQKYVKLNSEIRHEINTGKTS